MMVAEFLVLLWETWVKSPAPSFAVDIWTVSSHRGVVCISQPLKLKKKKMPH